jgi:hypothetical protein
VPSIPHSSSVSRTAAWATDSPRSTAPPGTAQLPLSVRRISRISPERAQPRSALLEEQGILADKARERDEVISRELFPGMEDARRDRYLAGLEAAIAARQRVVDELAALVGDAETVCDERGWLPAERRDLSLVLFKVRRATEVRELRARMPVRKAELEALTGRSERAALREALRTDVARLASLEAMPPMTAADMCSECADPARHCPGVTFNLQDGNSVGGPCPAWPQWATPTLEDLRADFRRAMQADMDESFAVRMRQGYPPFVTPAPQAPATQPHQ